MSDAQFLALMIMAIIGFTGGGFLIDVLKTRFWWGVVWAIIWVFPGAIALYLRGILG